MKTKLFTLFLAFAATLTTSMTAHADPIETFNSSLSAPGVYFGSGNANSNIDVLTGKNTDGSTLQLGLWGTNRGNPTPMPSATDDYYYTPTTGPNASFNLDFSVNTGTDPLSDYAFGITITDDTTGKVAFFNPTLLPDNAQVNSAGTVVCNGCAMNMANSGFQNSENFNFAFISSQLGGFNSDGTDTYTATFSAIPLDGSVDPSETVNFIAGNLPSPTPEPSSLVLLGTGLLGLGGLARRKFLSANPS